MALSKLAIWNMALAECPESRVDSIDEASEAAQQCRDQYQPALELLLEDHDYGFAIKRATLALLTNDRENEWDFTYALPADMARPRHLLPFAAATMGAAVYSWIGEYRALESLVPLRIAGSKLYANVEQAVLEYVSDSPSEALFTAKFARALALELASRIVMPLRKSEKRQESLIRMAEVARERAKADDMNRNRTSVRDFIPQTQLARDGYEAR